MLDRIDNIAVTRIGRRIFKKDNLKDHDDSYDRDTTPVETTLEDTHANLVSSLLPNGMHAPAIDLDIPVQLIASSTPGHFHLYIDKEISWDRYEDLLRAFVKAGLVEEGYFRQAQRFKQSFLRLPSVKKKRVTKQSLGDK